MSAETTARRRLDGKVILVAGAGGIGTGLARRYAAEGAQVVLGDIDVDGAEQVADDIRRLGHSASAIRLDGADEGSTTCLLYTSPSPRDKRQSRMPSSA